MNEKRKILTLKKPGKPMPKPRFYVWRKGTVPSRIHSTEEEARKEAERLANLNPGVSFRVLTVVGRKVRAPKRS